VRAYVSFEVMCAVRIDVDDPRAEDARALVARHVAFAGLTYEDTPG
jgi:hypothetical protein